MIAEHGRTSDDASLFNLAGRIAQDGTPVMDNKVGTLAVYDEFNNPGRKGEKSGWDITSHVRHQTQTLVDERERDVIMKLAKSCPSDQADTREQPRDRKSLAQIPDRIQVLVDERGTDV